MKNFKKFFDRHNIYGQHSKSLSLWQGSWSEMVQVIDTKTVDGAGKEVPQEDLSSISNSAGHRWDLNAGFEGAKKILETGWAEGLAKVPDTDCVTQQGGLGVSYEFDVTGENLDVGVYMSGDPECFMQEVPRPSAFGKLIRIGVSITHSVSVEADEILNRGLAIMALVDNLEAMGYSCAIDVLQLTKSNAVNGNLAVITTIKEQGDALNKEGVVYTLAHPAFFRRIQFRMLELLGGARANAESDSLGYGYGRPESFKVLESAIESMGFTYDLYFDSGATGSGSAYKTLEDAKKLIFKQASEKYGFIEYDFNN